MILYPAPRRFRPLDGSWDAKAAPRISFVRDLPAQGYRLRILPDGCFVEAADPAGLFYAGITLRQTENRCCEIEDWPDYPVRGIMLDVSRTKVPTMDTLRSIIDLLSGFKINHLQLYFEHAFAYAGHEAVWRDSSPFTPDEIRELDRYCRERFIDLVPNQNSLGHMERWLEHPQYRHLAELPEGGAPTPWGTIQEKATGLSAAAPETLEFLEDLYGQLLPCFTSSLFNAGCDEVFDLGLGKSRALCEEIGKGAVYARHIRALDSFAKKQGLRLMIWADMALKHSASLPGLPPDCILIDWLYEAGDPVEDHCRRLAASGHDFWICAGTSSWNSIAGRTANMISNVRECAATGRKYGAKGFLAADWGDAGHWQMLPVSFAGFVYAAAEGWYGEGQSNLSEALNHHVFGGTHDGAAWIELGNLYLQTGVFRCNATELFKILSSPASRGIDPSVGLENIERIRNGAKVLVCTGETKDEFDFTVDLLLFACDRAEDLIQKRTRVRGIPEELKLRYRELWLRRNRPGGLAESVGRMNV